MGACAFQGVEPNVFDLLDKDRIAISDTGGSRRLYRLMAGGVEE